MQDYDDKDLVIVAVFLLCALAIVVSVFQPLAAEVTQLVQNGFSGLFGVAIGRKLNQ